MEELEKYLKALMLLQIQVMQGSDQHFLPDVALAKAGFPYVEIGRLLGKDANAVRMAVNRSQSKRTTSGRAK